jgi:hypothetical protein
MGETIRLRKGGSVYGICIPTGQQPCACLAKSGLDDEYWIIQLKSDAHPGIAVRNAEANNATKERIT